MRSVRLRKISKVIYANHPHWHAWTVGSLGIFVIVLLIINLVRSNLGTDTNKQTDFELFLAGNLSALQPNSYDNIEESKVDAYVTIINQLTGIKAVATLEGNKLNHTWGVMGLEQHLPRYPGDRLKPWEPFASSGITNRVGAFGYFADSKATLDQRSLEQEKYYIAVQTLYLPDWNKRWAELKPWYNKRKMLVVNPSNGRSVVAVIGDAGPAEWTGKHFGGSPEVIHALGYKKEPREAIVLFIDEDETNPVPLGPVYFSPKFPTPVISLPVKDDVLVE